MLCAVRKTHARTLERKEFGFNAHFCRYAGRGLLPEAMKKHDPLAVGSLGVRSVNPLTGPPCGWLANLLKNDYIFTPLYVRHLSRSFFRLESNYF